MAESSHGQCALRPKGKSNCIYHRRILKLVCNTCQDLACVECVTSLHNGHYFLKLKDKIPDVKEDIKSFIDNTENVKLPTIQRAIISAKETLKKDTAHLDDFEKNVTKQFDRLKQDLEKLRTENTDIITGHIKELKTRQEDFNRFLKECKKVLQRGSHVDMYDVRNEVHDLKPLPGKPILGTAGFTPNTQPVDHLTESFGTVTICHSKQQCQGQEDRSVGHYQIPHTQPPKSTAKDRTQTNPEYQILRNARVIREFKPQCNIDAICTDKDGQVYTCTRCNNIVTQLNKKGEIQMGIEYDVTIDDVRVSPTTQHIWTCSMEDYSVMDCAPSQSPVVRFKTGLPPYCLCVTVDNHILIGMPEQITKYNTRGNILLVTKPSPSGQSVVSYPQRITECSVTQNVAVVDLNNEDVLVMDKNLQEIFRYRGDIPTKYEQTIKRRQEETFLPYDVRYDSVGNLVITDGRRGCVHLLSGDGGNYLTLIYTDHTRVYSVDIDVNNVLWVVTGDKVKLLQYCNTDV